MLVNSWAFDRFRPNGSTFELSALRLWGAASAVDSGAVITASHPPAAGTLSSLLSDDFSGTCAWPASVVASPGFWIKIALPAATEVAQIRLASPSADVFARRMSATASTGFIADARLNFSGAGVYHDVDLYTHEVRNASVLYLQGSTGLLDQSPPVNLVQQTGPRVFVDSDNMFDGKPTIRFSGVDVVVMPASSNFAFGTGDFTVAAWVKNPGMDGTSGRLVTNRISGGLAGTWSFTVQPTQILFTEVVAGEPGLAISNLSLPSGQFFHVAFTRAAGVLRAFIDGQQVGSVGNTTNFSAVRELAIGRAAPDEPSRWTGWVSGLVICKGSALWTANFTPPKIDVLGALPQDTSFAPAPRKVAQGGLNPQGSNPTKQIGLMLRSDVEFGGDGAIYGTVAIKADPTNTLVARRVRLRRSRDGLPVRETWSDANGAYRFDGISRRYEYDVEAWDHTGNMRSVLANNVTPEKMT